MLYFAILILSKTVSVKACINFLTLKCESAYTFFGGEDYVLKSLLLKYMIDNGIKM